MLKGICVFAVSGAFVLDLACSVTQVNINRLKVKSISRISLHRSTNKRLISHCLCGIINKVLHSDWGFRNFFKVCRQESNIQLAKRPFIATVVDLLKRAGPNFAELLEQVKYSLMVISVHYTSGRKRDTGNWDEHVF